MFAQKKDKSLRLCVDYRRLNDITIKNRYPLPLISSLLQQASVGVIFSKIDLRGAYNLVRMKDGHEWKTAFRTPFGLFEYLVMPFGLTNAPSCFQHFIDDIFRDLIGKTVVIYLDDILIFSSNLAQHQAHVREVLERLQQHGLFAKLEKCAFHLPEVEFLGYIVSSGCLKMDPSRVEAVRN